MFILARGGQSYARLRFNVGPGGSAALGVEVAFDDEFAGSDHTGWSAEYDANVEAEQPVRMSGFTSSKADEEDEIESLSAPGTGIYNSALWDEECLESWRDYIEMEDESV